MVDVEDPEGPPGADGAGDALLPVVCVGASAGGLGPTVELLRHLGPAPGLALVVVHHLDPSHPSSLVEILARATPLPVMVAADGARLQPNQVHVLPPGADLEYADGTLRVVPRADPGTPHLPLDRFLESLAQSPRAFAIAVVLSGSGADGARGVEAVKDAGGITFAQDASAEHRAMPNAAIATGCIDFVLPPVAIAGLLTRIGPKSAFSGTSSGDDAGFDRILRALQRFSGIDFTHYKPSTLRRRVQRRRAFHGLPNLNEYAQFLEPNQSELATLAEEVLIHVTSFFRDPGTFAALDGQVFPRLLESRPRDAALRIWIPGASTGEEVYSIAIALLEFLSRSGASEIPVKLFGTDVSQSAIDRARAGRYPTTIERDVSPARLRRFFVKTESGYQIRKEVRDLCVFARQDATKDPPFSGLDLISCRNLLIYLGTALQERLIRVFHYALKERGYLVLGTSETPRAFPGFTAVDEANKVFARTSLVPRTVLDFSDPIWIGPPAPTFAASLKSSGPTDVQREADRLVLARFAPPGVVITDDLAIVHFRGRTGAYLEPTPGSATFELLRMVREELRLPLRQLIDEARTHHRAARTTCAVLEAGRPSRPVEVEVIPFLLPATHQRYFVVLFAAPPSESAASTRDPGTGSPAPIAPMPGEEGALVQELMATRSYLLSVVEQFEASTEELKAANEEVTSTNEELRSTNEELQTAKEELQATNEELRTVNEEMQVRTAEGARLGNDLMNVLASVDIAMLVLDRDLRVRRFTPAATALGLGPADLGRPLPELPAVTHGSLLAEMSMEVQGNLGTAQRVVQDASGRWSQLTVRPYVTEENRVDGTVASVVDIDELEKGARRVAAARRQAESIVDTVRASLVVVDAELRITAVNRSLLRAFGGAATDLLGRPLSELGGGRLFPPPLLKRLSGLGASDALEEMRLAIDAPTGERVFLASARRIAESEAILIALDDVTEKVRATERQARTETAYRDMLMDAAVAIIMGDAAGRVVFANPAAERAFGYGAGEMLGLDAASLVSEAVRGELARRRSASLAAAHPEPVVLDGPISARRKDGTEFPVALSIGSVKLEGGPVVAAFVVDLSGRQAAERQIVEYRQRLQRMAFDAAVAEKRERRRMAVVLHDRIGQSLVVAQMKLAACRDTVTGPARARLEEALEVIAATVADTRSLTFELAPPLLYDLGLRAALQWLADDLHKRYDLEIEFVDDDEEKPLDDATAALVFRAARELLTNVFKHARVQRARVTLRRDDDSLRLEVKDEGAGFDTAEVNHRRAGNAFGLFSVQEQLTHLGGAVDIESTPGKGTCVTLRVPLRRGDGKPT